MHEGGGARTVSRRADARARGVATSTTAGRQTRTPLGEGGPGDGRDPPLTTNKKIPRKTSLAAFHWTPPS